MLTAAFLQSLLLAGKSAGFEFLQLGIVLGLAEPRKHRSLLNVLLQLQGLSAVSFSCHGGK